MGDPAVLYVIDDIPIFSGVPTESMGVHDALVFKWSWRAAKRDTKYAESRTSGISPTYLPNKQ